MALGGICEKERGRFRLGPLAVISPGDSDNVFLPVSWLRIPSAALASCNSKLDLGSWQVSSTCAIIYIGKRGDYFSRAKYMFDMAC